jgi:hypothetical protein
LVSARAFAVPVPNGIGRKQKRATLALTPSKGCWGHPFSTAKARYGSEAAKKPSHVHNFGLSDWPSPFGTEGWGRGGDLNTSLPVRCPMIAVQENGTYGGQGKAAGFVGRRLCCVNSVFLCSRSHRATSIRDQMWVRLTSRGR